ncbi:MAG TPA: hypothetical protein VIK68_02305 [Sphingomicrobium sp.]
MRTFGKRVDGLEGRRKSAREQVVLAGSALTLSSSRAVIVTEVSPTGAKLVGRHLPKKGTTALITVGKIELFADIVWSANDECGIAFEKPLSADVTDHLKREGRWAKVMGIEAAQ